MKGKLGLLLSFVSLLSIEGSGERQTKVAG